MKGSVIEWLLEKKQPTVRLRTLVELLDKSPDDPEVKKTESQIAKRGWAADILAEQLPSGYWVWEQNLYRPKYMATNWRLLVLADLGLTADDPRVRQACELILDHFSKPDGGFGTQGMKGSHLCVAGNTARMMIQFGYMDDSRVRSAIDWLVREQKEDGGWHCWGKRGTLDCWEALSAFAAMPRNKWTQRVGEAVEKGAQFYLERQLYREGKRYEPWFRFHYPVHYYYDLLTGLDLLTSLDYADDRRLRYALDYLRKKQRPDGSWSLDAVHPDVAGREAAWMLNNARPPTPLGLEWVDAPSKVITLRALRVLKRVEGELP